MSKRKNKKQKASVKNQGSNVSKGRPSGEVLKESEKKELEMFRDVAECAFDWIYEVDAEGICTYTSSAVERSMGYRPQDMVGLLFTDFFHPDDREQLIKAAQALMARKQPFREFVARYVHKNGQTVWLSTSGTPIFDDKGNLLGYRGTNTDITERKRLEDALRESEERYRSLFENSPVSIGLGSPDGKVISANKAMLDMTGYSVEEVPEVNLNDVYENLEDRKALLEQVKKYGGVSNYPARIKRKDGTVIDALLSASAVHVGDEQLLQTTLIDVTERKQAEEALRESEEKWRTLVQNLPDFVLTVDRDGTVQTLNRAMPGATVEEVIGSKIYDYVLPEHHDVVEKAIEGVFQSGRPGAYEILGVGPRGPFTAWYETRVVPVKRDGQIAAVTLISTDITESRQAHKALRESEEKFRLTFEAAKDAIFWADPETGLITNCNKAAESLFGKKREEIVGQHQTSIHPPKKAKFYANMFKEHIEKRGVADDEAEVITKSGKIVPVHITASVTKVGGRSIIQGIFRDITFRKQAEEQLKAYSQNLEHMVEERTNELDKARARLFHSSKLVAVGRMGAGIAHQLNSPLCSGLLFVDSLMQDYQNAPKQQRVLQNVRRSLMDMRDIVECMLSMAMVARPGAPSRANVNLNEVLKRVVDVAGLECKKRHVTVETLFDPELPAIEAVVGELDQVFINLVNNAIDIMADGGMLSVHTVSLPGSVEILIRDTGKGIAPEHLDQIFEPFFTTRLAERGIGLGLSVAREIVERHRGHISVKSQPGKGSTFTVRLPVPSHKPATGV